MLTLAATDYGSQQHQLAAFRQGERLIDHLRDGLGFQINRVVRAARRTGACIQQAQVIVDLGNGTDGGARVVGGRFLFDGNRR